MWMMGCNEGSEFINRSDSVKTRRLRPLMPRPTTAIPTNNTYSAVANPYCSCLLKANLSTLNDHLATMKEQSKADINTEIPLASSRWNPTPDHLHALKELYRGGTRTPTANQIQQIAAKLRRFGKIEGKNVFYWFQNHKARERQKRSRILDSFSEEEDIESLERKEPGTGFEVAQSKYGATSSNCSTLSEDSVSINRAVGSESRIDGWIQSEERELTQQRSRRRSKQTKHATWQLMKPSSPPPTIHLMNTTTAPEEALGTVDPNLSSTQNLKMQPRTLQLFPIDEDQSVSNVNHGSSFTPDQFFEFLPLKN